jgi:transposase
MALRRRQFTRDFKVQILREIEAGKTLAEVSRRHQVNPGTIVAWRKQFEQYGEQAFQGNGNAYTDEARIAELERALGQAHMEIALLKRALLRLETQAPRTASNGGAR